jgi:hypothetical protein
VADCWLRNNVDDRYQWSPALSLYTRMHIPVFKLHMGQRFTFVTGSPSKRSQGFVQSTARAHDNPIQQSFGFLRVLNVFGELRCMMPMRSQRSTATKDVLRFVTLGVIVAPQYTGTS